MSGNTSRDSVSIDIDEYGDLTRDGRHFPSAQSYDKQKELVVVDPVDSRRDSNSDINLHDESLVNSNAIFHPVYDNKRNNCIQSTMFWLKKPTSQKAFALIGCVFLICLIVILALIPVFQSDNQNNDNNNAININNSGIIQPVLPSRTTTRPTSNFISPIIPIPPETMPPAQHLPTSVSSKRATKAKTQTTTNLPLLQPTQPIQPLFQPTFQPTAPNFVSDFMFVTDGISTQPTEPVNFTFQDFVPDRRIPADIVPNFPNGQNPNFN